MFDDHWVGLLATGSLVCDGIKRPLNAVDGHSCFVGMVDTHPAEAHRLQPALQLHVHRKPLPDLVMYQRNPKF